MSIFLIREFKMFNMRDCVSKRRSSALIKKHEEIKTQFYRLIFNYILYIYIKGIYLYYVFVKNIIKGVVKMKKEF